MSGAAHRRDGAAQDRDGVAKGRDSRTVKSRDDRAAQGRDRAAKSREDRDNRDGRDPARQEAVVADTGQGSAIIRSTWIGTAGFLAAAAVGAPVKGARLPAVVVDLGLFAGGAGVFLWALAVAASRSRERDIELWSLFLLEGVAPPRVRKALLGALAVEVVAALATAWISAALAFGCLVPLWALAHCGLWGARYGAFGPRPAAEGHRQRDTKG